jgi:hypothetical protein
VASENTAYVDQLIAVHAGQYVPMGYTTLSVDWKPAE